MKVPVLSVTLPSAWLFEEEAAEQQVLTREGERERGREYHCIPTVPNLLIHLSSS